MTRAEAELGGTPITQVAENATRDRERFVIVVLFLFNVAMVYPVFFPSLNQINAWDQSVYVHQGKALIEGSLPQFSSNPAVAVLYAVTYLPFMKSQQWLVHTDALGRFVLFVLLWVSSLLIARKLAGFANPLTMIAFVAISPVVPKLFWNGSDALFAAMSGLALWQFLSFRGTRCLMHLALCSAFVGLAALSRPEGSLLFVVFVVLTIGVSLSTRGTPTTTLRHSVAVLVPFFVLVGGYVGIYGMRTGHLSLGSAQRSYTAFEQGHGIAFASSYGTLNPFVEGQKDARRLFGTPEENNYSILTAIERNPPAYLQRIPRLTYLALTELLELYHWHFAVFCFAFVVRGIIALIRARSYGLLAILLLWPASNLLHILIIYQSTHLLLSFVTVFALATIGVGAAAANLDSRLERQWWIAGLLALTGLGVMVYRPSNDLLVAPILVLGGLWLTWLVARQVRGDASAKARVACLMFLAAALFIRFGILHEAVPARSSSPDAQATTWLRDHIPPGTRIGAYAPGVIWAANMTPVTNPEFSNLTTSEALWAWLRREKVEAIYVDDALRTYEPVAWQTIRSQIGQGLELAFDKASDRPSFDWRNAMFHSRPTDSEPVQVVIRRPKTGK